jgi:endogenous inhibitor of DNA gyrase (YacG/DUF329 family)
MKGTKLYSIFKMKCPKCHESDIYTNKNHYNFSTIFEMNDPCPYCGQKLEMEPGFFYGSMYVSYGVGVAFFVAMYVAFMVLYSDFTTKQYLVVSVLGAIVLTPYFFRLSRSIWLNLFVGYDKSAAKSQSPESDSKA